MKNSFIFCLIILLTVFSACKEEKPSAPVNSKASPEAERLLNFLYSIQGNRILTGQHNYGHEVTRSSDSVYSRTGKYPAIWGSDLLGYDQGSSDTRQLVIDEAIRQHEKGSIITLMYHQVKPFHHDSLGFARSVKGRVSDEEWRQIVTPGTAYHRMWLEKIDRIAGYLQQLNDRNIPVLWRPYHEMNGIWFWYGDRPGPEGIAKLWIMMFERYVNDHGLNNLIWVWNANAPRDWPGDQAYAYADYFPGLDYVDVLAADIYKNDYKQSHHDDLVSLAGGKPIAMGECGHLPAPGIMNEQPEWVWFMDWARFIWTANSPEDVRTLYDHPRCISLEELQTMR